LGQPKSVNVAADQWRRKGCVQWTKNVEPLPKVNRWLSLNLKKIVVLEF
jgi:hypothetical protein